jgi:hypothetical protein
MDIPARLDHPPLVDPRRRMVQAAAGVMLGIRSILDHPMRIVATEATQLDVVYS